MELVTTLSWDFYPRPPRGGRLLPIRLCQTMRHFYPRPPRGGRRYAIVDVLLCFLISIHALREEGDRRGKKANQKRAYFYPRPPRGGRRLCPRSSVVFAHISIHALREEGDRYTRDGAADIFEFLSTPSARRATLREKRPGDFLTDFYPRPPRGGRLITTRHLNLL